MSVFGKGKSGEDHRDSTPLQQNHQPNPARKASPPGSPETETTIGTDITIVGKIIGTGTVKVFGRIEGELNASDVIIAEGAQIEGNVIAQALTVGGHVKGTIHAVRAKLLGTAKVEGDIFHRSLSIDENALFEGSSRREQDPTGKKPDTQPATTPAPTFKVQATSIDSHDEALHTSEAFAP